MFFFDERVLAALKDGKPRGFTTLLCEMGLTHNNLQQDLNRLVARDLVVKEKMVSNDLGRPNSITVFHLQWRSRLRLRFKTSIRRS